MVHLDKDAPFKILAFMRCPEVPEGSSNAYENVGVVALRLFKRPSDGASVLALAEFNEDGPRSEVLIAIDEHAGPRRDLDICIFLELRYVSRVTDSETIEILF